MKTTKLTYLTALFVAAAFSLSGAAQSQSIGVVKRVGGDVSLARADGVVTPIVGDALLRDDRVHTGDDGVFGATLSDGTTIALGRNSDVEIASFVFNPGARLYDLLVRVFAGRIVLRTGLIGEEAPDRVRVETPQLLVGVRGTRFAIVIEDEQ